MVVVKAVASYAYSQKDNIILNVKQATMDVLSTLACNMIKMIINCLFAYLLLLQKKNSTFMFLRVVMYANLLVIFFKMPVLLIIQLKRFICFLIILV